MHSRFEKSLPLILVLCGVLLYVVKYYAGMPVLYYPLLVIVALFSASIAQRVISGRPFKSFVPSYRTSTIALFSVVALFFLVFTAMAIGKFNAFSLRMYDFGLMDQAIWNTAHGRLLEVTDLEYPFENVSRLSTHLEVIYGAFAALYLLISDPRILFVGQTLFVCAAIVLVFIIARTVLGSNRQALAIAAAAALFPALQFMVLFDFHGDVLAIPFFLVSYLGYLRKNRSMFWLGLVLALFCKEYAGLAAAGYGGALMAAHRDFKRGAIAAAIGLLYFLTAFYVVGPLFNDGHQSVLTSLDYGAIGGNQGLGGMLRFAVVHPIDFLGKITTTQNAESLFYLFFPLAFLPLLSPAFMLGAVPVFFKDALFGMDIGNHHFACGLPFLFISFVYGIRRCGKIMENHRLTKPFAAIGLPCTLVIAASVIATVFYGPSPLGHRFWRARHVYSVSDHSRACETIIETIPVSARVSASDNLAPHLTHRRYCYVFPAPLELPSMTFTKAEYICIDTTNGESLVWGHTSYAGQTLPLIRSIGFDSIMETDGVFLFKKRQ